MKMCPECDRHLMSLETRCPFCRASLSTTAAGLVLRATFSIGVLGAVACTARGDLQDAAAGTSAHASDDSGSESGGATNEGTTAATTLGTTTEASTGNAEATADTSSADAPDDWDDQGGSFYAGPTDSNRDPSCDIIAQDCPEGEKCLPWASDGGPVWNANRCSPIDAPSAALSEPCMVFGSAVSGIDSCDLGLVCLGVDPETNEGVCVGVCQGSLENPSCEDPDQVCGVSNGGVLAVCVDACNPLLDPCADGLGCYPTDDGNFGCYPTHDLGGAQDESCVHLSNCDPGNACVASGSLSACDGAACCTAICDLGAPACPDGLSCEPWYRPGQAPPGVEAVGACVL